MLVATLRPTMTQSPTSDDDGRCFPGPRIDPNTPGAPYQVDETEDEPDEILAKVTTETAAQDAPASGISSHHAVSNAFGHDFVAIPPGGH